MSVAATTQLSVRTDGSDNNGGGFNLSASGVNYSLQAAAQWAITDLAAAQNSTTITSAASTFTSNAVGNLIQIVSGTNFIVGWYEVKTFVDAHTLTVDRAPATAGIGSGGTANIGGALISPGMAGKALNDANFSNGCDTIIKTGTYSITSATANISGGCVSIPGTTSGVNCFKFRGYNTTVGDISTDNSLARPLFQASGISTFALLTAGSGNYIEGIDVDGATLTSSRGITAGAGTYVNRCKALNCTNSGISGNAASRLEMCEATGCTTIGAGLNGGNMYFCLAYANSVSGIANVSAVSNMVGCYSINNTGATSDGFLGSAASLYTMQNCVAYGNGRHGFNPASATGSFCVMENCYAENNGGYGFTASSAYDAIVLNNCGGYNNTSGNVNATNITGLNTGFISATASAFVNPAANDFSLNSNTGAGAALRSKGLPGATTATRLRGIATNSNVDVGASQHADPTTTNHPIRVGYSGGL